MTVDLSGFTKSQLRHMVETIEITDFSGRLTRKLNGNLNSGFAKFSASSGYDPFSKPGNLTWMESPVDITGNGPSSIVGLMLAAKPRFENGLQQIYAVTSLGSVKGNLYKLQPIAAGSPNNPNLNTASLIGVVGANSPNFTRGASMEFYNAPTSVISGFGGYQRIYVGSDSQINSVGLDGSTDIMVGSGAYATSVYRPLKKFVGKLLFGNGNTIGAISANTGTVTSSIIGTGQGDLYSELDPPLPVNQTVHDLDISIDGNYALITASGIQNEQILAAPNPADAQNAVSSDGNLYGWNGTDGAVTTGTQIPSYAVTALQTYLQSNTFFSDDAFGSSMSNGSQKLFTLVNNKSPLPNATAVNGTFLTWVVPEYAGGVIFASMYYYGSLDQENPPGLWRVFRISSTLTGGFFSQIPLNILVSNSYFGANSNKSGISKVGYGKHYFSTYEQNSTTDSYKLYQFLVTPSGTGTPLAGVYETQTQLFPKRITVKQVRIYTEPTASGNGFQLSLMGSDGNQITNGSFTYSYAAGTDVTQLQGSLERIDWNPKMGDTYAIGVNILNIGSVNMTIKKIEIDWSYSGK